MPVNFPNTPLPRTGVLDFSNQSEIILPGGWSFSKNGTTIPPGASALGASSIANILDPQWGAGTGTGGDDSAAFVAALTWVNAQPKRGLFLPPAPAGSYNYNQNANGPIVLSATESVLFGIGDASEITFTGSGSSDGVKTTGDRSQVHDLKLSTTTKTGGYLLNYNNGNAPVYRNITLWENGTGNAFGLTCATPNLYVFFDRLRILNSGTASVGIDFATVTSLIFGSNFSCQGPSASTGTSAGIRCNASVSQDTAVLTNFMINNYFAGVQISPQGTGVVQDWHVSNGIVDQTTYALYYNLAVGASVYRIKWDNVWFAAGGATPSYGLFHNTSSPNIFNQTFTSCRFYAQNAGGTGILWQSGGATSGAWQFIGCIIELSEKGVVVDNDANVDFIGCFFNDNTTDVFFGAHTVFSAANMKRFMNCRFGSQPISFQDLISTYGGLIHIKDAYGYTPFILTASPAVPAAAVVFSNPHPFDCMVEITADAAGATTVNISNAFTATIGQTHTIAAGATKTFLIRASAKLTLAYTNAPTWTWEGV